MALNGWNGFVDVPLKAQDKKAIKAWAKKTSPDQLMQQVVEIVTDGYKLSISNDEANQTFVVALTGKGDDNVNSGFTMSQRHADLHVALAAVVFTHVELGQRGEWAAIGNLQQAFDW